ncbi:MAG: alpha/beta hydrolase, partial [Actinomycetota bacterium]
AGFTVVAVDFRDGRQARHPAATDDIAAAIAWVRDHPDLDVDRLALTGSSSGGHLALHVALTEVPVRAVAALWPPVDPLARYHYAVSLIGQPVPEGNRLNAPGLVASTEAYFGDTATMGRASIAEIVRSGRAVHLPSVLVVEAGADLNVPASMLDDLEQAYLGAGGQLDRRHYPGEIHGFGHGTHAGAVRFGHDLVDWLIAALG